MNDEVRSIEGISALADPVRRDVYRYVCEQRTPVSRDQAASALGLSRHQASSHLDRLAKAGLLASSFARLTGRTGPGAGRPAKVYQRRPEEIAVSLPNRQYALAGEILTCAVDEAIRDEVPIAAALAAAATRRGAGLAASADAGTTPIETATAVARTLGYEPRLHDGRVVLANCPFHALVTDHVEVVCRMNHALLGGVCDQLGGLTAVLEPGDGRCCVLIEPDRRPTTAAAPSATTDRG
jgi:predicted ArsR family transcriptional regulator